MSGELSLLDKAAKACALDEAPVLYSLRAKVEGCVTLAALPVETSAQAQAADGDLRRIKAVSREVAESFVQARIDDANRTASFWRGVRDTLTKQLDEASMALKRKLAAFNLRAEEAARAERAKREAEAFAKAEAARLAEAERLEAMGLKAAADAALDAPILPEVAKIEAPKPVGVTMRDNWKHRVVVEALVPRAFLTVNDKALAAHARATKGSVPVEGVEFYNEPIVASLAERPIDVEVLIP